MVLFRIWRFVWVLVCRSVRCETSLWKQWKLVGSLW